MNKWKRNASKKRKQGSIFDDVMRTAQERHGKLLVPLVNETFAEHYSSDVLVRRLPDDYQGIVSKTVADACNVIGERVYHMEVQSRNDKTMVLRMVEYDFVIGLAGADKDNGKYHIRFPRSCVIYLRHNGTTPQEEEMELEFQNGQVVYYRVPTVLVQNYSLDEIFEKKLYLFLPFYIMRYEKDLDDIASSEERREALLGEIEVILERLEHALCTEPNVYQDLLMLMHKVADYLLREHEEFKEEVGAVMGGKVLPLPSDAWREANERAHAEGLQQGLQEGLQQGLQEGLQEGLQQGLQGQHQILVRSIENAMQNFRIDLETACKGLGTTVGEYQAAKEALKVSVRRTTG